MPQMILAPAANFIADKTGEAPANIRGGGTTLRCVQQVFSQAAVGRGDQIGRPRLPLEKHRASVVDGDYTA